MCHVVPKYRVIMKEYWKEYEEAVVVHCKVLS
jgi:hypothetical protein